MQLVIALMYLAQERKFSTCKNTRLGNLLLSSTCTETQVFIVQKCKFSSCRNVRLSNLLLSSACTETQVFIAQKREVMQLVVSFKHLHRNASFHRAETRGNATCCCFETRIIGGIHFIEIKEIL